MISGVKWGHVWRKVGSIYETRNKYDYSQKLKRYRIWHYVHGIFEDNFEIFFIWSTIYSILLKYDADFIMAVVAQVSDVASGPLVLKTFGCESEDRSVEI